MINLLPPAIKTDLRYSRYNAMMVRYVIAGIVLTLLLGATFVGARIYLANELKTINGEVAESNLKIAGFSTVQKQAAEVNSRAKSIQTIQLTQARFSLLLSDLAQATPQGVTINQIILTGDDKKPVRVSATAKNYESAVAFREGISHSPRISAADIESIQDADSNSAGNNSEKTVTVTFAFNPGKAR